MSTKKIRDMVIPLAVYPRMLESGTLREAIEKLLAAYETGHHTVLVFDEAGNLVSMLFERDILRGLEPRFAQRYEEVGVPIFWDKLMASKAGWDERLSRPVSEFLKKTEIVIEVEDARALLERRREEGRKERIRALPAINVQDSILKAAHVMVRERVFVLPVMEDSKILGFVRMGDIFRELANLVLNL